MVLTVLASGGGGAVVAYGAFRFFAVSWIEQKFEQQLEAYRHENAKELQSLSASVDGALSKTIKSQEKEFEVLSELWRLANMSVGTLGSLVSPLQSYPNLRNMSAQKMKEVLEQYDLLPSVMQEILDASDNQKEFIEAAFWKQLNSARNALNDFRNCLYLNEVFIEQELMEEFEGISKQVVHAIVEREMSHEDSDHKMRGESFRVYDKEISPRLKALAPSLRRKFFDRI
ncbi:hypothetical protein [Yoonia sp. F2084L]|uniref:hypothetical protein n=1 Tax=Yoonia sp. F2084L TaxID=2926419 RepID=UPI001FF14B53|nr:hypothetical protein [Yoonia sp. F2084L]